VGSFLIVTYMMPFLLVNNNQFNIEQVVGFCCHLEEMVLPVRFMKLVGPQGQRCFFVRNLESSDIG